MGMLEEYRDAREMENTRPQLQQLLTQGVQAVIERVDALGAGLRQVQRDLRLQAESGAVSQQVLSGVAQMLSQLQLPDNSAELTMLNAKLDEMVDEKRPEQWIFDIQRNDEGLITSITATEAGEDDE